MKIQSALTVLLALSAQITSAAPTLSDASTKVMESASAIFRIVESAGADGLSHSDFTEFSALSFCSSIQLAKANGDEAATKALVGIQSIVLLRKGFYGRKSCPEDPSEVGAWMQSGDAFDDLGPLRSYEDLTPSEKERADALMLEVNSGRRDKLVQFAIDLHRCPVEPPTGESFGARKFAFFGPALGTFPISRYIERVSGDPRYKDKTKGWSRYTQYGLDYCEEVQDKLSKPEEHAVVLLGRDPLNVLLRNGKAPFERWRETSQESKILLNAARFVLFGPNAAFVTDEASWSRITAGVSGCQFKDWTIEGVFRQHIDFSKVNWDSGSVWDFGEGHYRFRCVGKCVGYRGGSEFSYFSFPIANLDRKLKALADIKAACPGAKVFTPY